MKKHITLTVIAILLTTGLFAQKPEIFSTDAGAIQGYDPVAFFKESKPVLGKKEFMYSWNGADWYFSNSENMSSFKAAPEKYAPQYGGYCAYGTAKGHKAPTQPETWTVINNKLYFNYSDAVKNLWSKDQDAFIKNADKNWPDVKKQ